MTVVPTADERATTALNAAAPSIAIELRDLAEIASAAHSHVCAAAMRGTEYAAQGGRALNEAKRIVGYGRWIEWLKQNCPEISERTAQLYMRIAKKLAVLDVEEAQRVARLSLRKVAKHLAEPKPNGRHRRLVMKRTKRRGTFPQRAADALEMAWALCSNKSRTEFVQVHLAEIKYIIKWSSAQPPPMLDPVDGIFNEVV